MRLNVFFLLALASGALFSQTQNPPAGETPAAPASSQQPAEAEKDPVYVRRISLAATLSVIHKSLIPEREERIRTTNPAVEGLFKTEGRSRLQGYGGAVQLALTERFALHGSVLLRRAGYRSIEDIHEGVDNPLTVVDERRYRARTENTRSRYMDIPVLLRYFGKDRHERGQRWFVEGGAALRKVRSIGTSVETTAGAIVSCCDTTPATPANRTVRGAVAGFGVYLIDPIGLRIIPEVRYTRWMKETFTGRTTSSQRHQIEFMFSFSF